MALLCCHLVNNAKHGWRIVLNYCYLTYALSANGKESWKIIPDFPECQQNLIDCQPLQKFLQNPLITSGDILFTRNDYTCTDPPTHTGTRVLSQPCSCRNRGRQLLLSSVSVKPVTVWGLARYIKVNFWKLFDEDVLQAGCPSCHPMNNTKALKGYTLALSCAIRVICYKYLPTVSNVLSKQVRSGAAIFY